MSFSSLYRSIKTRVSSSVFFRGLEYLHDFGFRAFFRELNRRLLLKRYISQAPQPVILRDFPVKTIGQAKALAPLQEKVSVIIPTKNAGEEFDYMLRRIARQEHVSEIEIVVVDSGSVDRTLEIAREYTSKIIEIPPESFHHARTRNLAAQSATGEFLVFTVQDAIPIGFHWLYRLIRPLQQDQVSAVTSRQIPRSDSDLFWTWTWSAHNRYLCNDRDRIINNSYYEGFEDLDVKSTRAFASLDNVCLGIKKEIFHAYLFDPRCDYAEDLELGVRLLKDGHNLMFQTSNGVIHSHRRPASYFLKRSYVDTATIGQLFRLPPPDAPAAPILEALSHLYARLKACLLSPDPGTNKLEGRQTPFALLIDLLEHHREVSFKPSWKSLGGDAVLDTIFAGFPPKSHPALSEELFRWLRHSLESLSQFVGTIGAVGVAPDQFTDCIYKVFAQTAGAYLATHSVGSPDFMGERV